MRTYLKVCLFAECVIVTAFFAVYHYILSGYAYIIFVLGSLIVLTFFLACFFYKERKPKTINLLRGWSLALSILACITTCYCRLSPHESCNTQLLSSVLTFSGILGGFLMTSKTILITANAAFIAPYIKNGYWPEITGLIKEAMSCSLFVCVLAIIGFFIPTGLIIFWGIFIGAVLYQLAFFAKVTQVMFRILDSRESSEEQNIR